MIIIKSFLELITNNRSELWKLSILRYKSSRYQFFSNSLMDHIFWFVIFPIFWVFFIPKSFFQRKKLKNNKSKIIFQVGNNETYKIYFSNLVNRFSEEDYLIEGDNFNIPSIKDYFTLTQTIYLSLLFPMIWIIILILSVFSSSNIFRALIRSTYVYFRTLNHFNSHPTDNYFTYQDNSCSAAFYLAFKKAGGKRLIAFQNGIRNINDGIDGSCFDHFFAMSPSSIDLYKKCKSNIQDHDIIGCLNIYNNPKLLEKKIETIDILFIDQGFPGKNLEQYLELTTFQINDLRRYLSDIKKFSIKFPNLKIGYQLRPYPDKFSYLIDEANNWFKETSVVLYQKKSSYDSLHRIQESKVVVTIDSTIGLESLSIGKVTLFTNHGINENFEIIPGSRLQLKCDNYEVLEENILYALKENLNEEVAKTSYYIPQMSSILSEDIVFKRLNKFIE